MAKHSTLMAVEYVYVNMLQKTHINWVIRYLFDMLVLCEITDGFV